MFVTNVTCVICNATHQIKANLKDYVAWRDGALIQKAMPYLSTADRELLISGACDSCFKEMFSEEVVE